MKIKESIAETRKLKLVRTKLVNGYYFEIFTKRKNGYGVCCFLSRDEEEARKKFAKLKREMVYVMSSAEELREDLKAFQRNFEKLTEEINDIFLKYIDFSYKAKQQMNEMQKRLLRLEELERKRK